MRWIFSVFLAFIVVFAASTADARPRHKHRHHARHHHHYVHHARHHVRHARRHVHRTRGYQVASLGGVGDFAGVISNGIVRASTGARARVNPQYASRFQCLVNRLEATGYRIRFMGGYRHTKIAGTRIWSKHASGRAIDINQTGRNRCRGGCPHFAGIARSCGLTDGKDWHHADAGHFEVP